jgi:16S rRNA G527 N7-methylase RsmG
MSHLLREHVEMVATLNRDLDLVHPATSDAVLETHTLALHSVCA